jgi:hypothetical protein
MGHFHCLPLIPQTPVALYAALRNFNKTWLPPHDSLTQLELKDTPPQRMTRGYHSVPPKYTSMAYFEPAIWRNCRHMESSESCPIMEAPLKETDIKM